MNPQKDELRRQMREENRRHSPEECAIASRQICDRIRTQPIWQRAKSVLLFVPIASEPDISPLMKNGKQVSLPSFNAKLAQYEGRRIAGSEDLVPGQFGILEPSPSCPLTDLTTVDLVLTPGVAFSRDGVRLGRGKGYYDRLLTKLKAVKCGVCFDWQLLQAIPRDGHDVAMDHLVTPTLFF